MFDFEVRLVLCLWNVYLWTKLCFSLLSLSSSRTCCSCSQFSLLRIGMFLKDTLTLESTISLRHSYYYLIRNKFMEKASRRCHPCIIKVKNKRPKSWQYKEETYHVRAFSTLIWLQKENGKLFFGCFHQKVKNLSTARWIEVRADDFLYLGLIWLNFSAL